jgi:hypothetical protein
MRRITTTTLVLLLFITTSFGQHPDKRIDPIITAKTTKLFNGIIFISQNEKTKYSKVFGYSDLEKRHP